MYNFIVYRIYLLIFIFQIFGMAALVSASALLSQILKFLANDCPNFFKVSSYSFLSFQVFLGFKISVGTPSIAFGMWNPKTGNFSHSMLSNYPSWIASMILLVILRLILFPTPYFPPDHPVLTNHPLHLCSLILSASYQAQTVGCNGMKASPKHDEKVGTGSMIPISVPATLAVYPEMKWNLDSPGDSLAIGGKTPKASQVKKMMFLACPAIDGNLAFGMCSNGQQALVFSVMETSSQLTTPYSSGLWNLMFSKIAPNLMALKISGSFSAERLMHLAQQPPSMLKTPFGDQQCSSSPNIYLFGSAERVVFPVPERPKQIVTSPFFPSVAEAWREAIPYLGIKQFMTPKRPFFISPAY